MTTSSNPAVDDTKAGTASTPRAVCPIERLPDEMLHKVFTLVCFDDNSSFDRPTLHRMCSVDRRWREAATTCPNLWTHLPHIHLGGKDTLEVANFNQHLELYLSRSGTLPLSFRCTMSLYSEATHSTKTLERLIGECHRWGSVELVLPTYQTYKLLEPIRGKLLSLVRLNVDLSVRPFLAGAEQVYDIFFDAPKLRRVSWTMTSTFGGFFTPSTGKTILLPFSQLEELRMEDLVDTNIYQNLMETPSPQLRTLSYVVKEISSLPPKAPIFLPHLEKLQLVAHTYSCDIVSHLDCLTLPSLKHLEIRGRHPTEVNLYAPVLSLLQRSGCSLDYLFFVSPVASPQVFKEILSLSPNLTALGILMPDAVTIGHLQATSSSSFIPKLKRLILQKYSDHAPYYSPPTNAAYKALVRAIRSRSVDLWTWPSSDTAALEQVTFLCENQSSLTWGLLNKQAMMQFDHYGTAELPQDELKVLPWATLYWESTMHTLRCRLNIKRHWKLHKILRNLEKLDFTNRDTHKLVRHGYPRILRALSEKPAGTTAGDHMFFFRARAKKLLEKWKPHMLRDARKYWWSSHSKGVLMLKFNVAGTEGDEEELYKDLVGLQRSDPAAQANFADLTRWVAPGGW